MTDEQERQRKATRIRSYIQLADSQAKPHSRLTCLLNNLGYEVPEKEVQATYERFRGILEAELEKLK